MSVFIMADEWMSQWSIFGNVESIPSTLNFNIKTNSGLSLGVLVQFRIEENLNG